FRVLLRLQTYPAKICGRIKPGEATDLLLLPIVKTCLASPYYSFVEAILSVSLFDFSNSLLDTSPRCSKSVKLEHLENARSFVSYQLFIAEPMYFDSLLLFGQVP